MELFLIGFPMGMALLLALMQGIINYTYKDSEGNLKGALPFSFKNVTQIWKAGAVLCVAVEFAAAIRCLFMSLGIDGATLNNISLAGLEGNGLQLTIDGFRTVYVCVTAFLWLISTLVSVEYMKHHEHVERYYFFLLMTLGATMGVFVAADMFTLLVFFEIMSFTSYVWVAQEETPAAMRAAQTYLAVSVIGGMSILMGLFLLWHGAGTLVINELPEAVQQMGTVEKWSAAICMLVGFGAKAGAVPLHIWLPKAHPVAPAPASALLSGLLTKTGIFGILILSLWIFAQNITWGCVILFIGIVTMVTGAVLALFSIDLKRTLACSSVSQIGFILTGIGAAVLLGEENDLALQGVLLHMMNHSFIKLVLFCAAGVIYQNLHKLDLNDIRGFGRHKPLLAAVFGIGAWSIAGIPLGSGYISKTLIHEGLVECMELELAFPSAGLLKAMEWLFLISGGLTLAYMTKLFVAIFIEKNESPEKQAEYDKKGAKGFGKSTYWNYLTSISLCVAAGFLLIWGLFSSVLMQGAADLAKGFLRHEGAWRTTEFFRWSNLQGAVISMTIGVLVYFLIVRLLLMKDGRYVNRWPAWLDLEDRVYRPLLNGIAVALGAIMKVMDRGVVWISKGVFAAFTGIIKGLDQGVVWIARGVFRLTDLLRLADKLPDALIIFLRKTVYKDSPIPHELEEGTRTTHVAGSAIDKARNAFHPSSSKEDSSGTSVEHRLAIFHVQISESNMLIVRSLSFGLLLFCIGLVVTLIYLLM